MIKKTDNKYQHDVYDDALDLINETLHQYHHQLLQDQMKNNNKDQDFPAETPGRTRRNHNLP